MALGPFIKGSVIAAVAAVSLAGGTAHADDVATKRLTKFGKLAPAAASRVANAVSAKMKRAADMTNSGDPLRVAVSQALFGSPQPADTMGAAKVRLRLYAGLNEWALDNVFVPKPGGIASCINSFQLPPGECEALLAAGGKTSLADARKSGGGAAPGGGGGQSQGPGQSYGFARQPQGGGYGNPPRAQQYGQPQGGYRPMQGYGQQQPQGQYGYRPQQQAQAQGQYGYRPAAQPAYGARPGAAPARPAAAPAAAPPPSAAQVASRKAEYERKRQEYLDRKRAEMEARKSKVVATAGGTERIQRGPGSETEAEVAGLDKSEVAQPAKAGAAKPTAAGKPAAAPIGDEPIAEAPPAKEEKPALDNELLGDLLGDPLGKK